MDDRKPAAKPDSSALSGKKSKRKSATGNRKKRKVSDTIPDLSAILPWIPRSQLETLITSSVTDQTCITTQELINAMPESEQWRVNSDGRKKTSVAPVKSGPERINTGDFDVVDITTMYNIFTYLNCKEKHTCVTSVCKGWRDFKTSMPTLFLDLSDNSWDVRGRAMAAEKILELMDWVPNLGKITALRISTQDKCNPNTCKQIVKKLVAAKKKAREPMITKLVLYGPKIYGSLIPELKKSGIGKTLTSLTFHQVKTTQQTKLEGAIDDLFRSLEVLEELYMPQSVVGADLRSKIFSPLMAARSGGVTLLRVLDLGERSSWNSQINLLDLSKIGSIAPELEVLCLASIKAPIHANQLAHVINPELILESPMAPLPRLKKFAVNWLVESFAYRRAPRYPSTGEVNRLLTWLLVGMPTIENFSLRHGKTSMTRKDEKMFSYPSLPGIVQSGRDVTWPRTLKHLVLSTFSLGADTFNATTELPSLQTLDLKECGGNVDTIINGLRRSHPSVKVTKSEDRGW